MTTNTKPALTFADQIAELERIQQSLDTSTGDGFDDYVDDFGDDLGRMIQLMKDWPAELITNKLRESFNVLIQEADRSVGSDGYEVALTVDYLINHVLPVLSAGDGLDARLKIAEEMTNRICADCGSHTPGYGPGSRVYVELVSPYLFFGIAIKDHRKWSAQLTEKIEKTCEEFDKEMEIQKNYFDAVRYEDSIRKKLGIDPDVELSEELLLDKFNAMKEANPDAHPNTIASWKRAANSLYMLVLYTTTTKEKEEE